MGTDLLGLLDGVVGSRVLVVGDTILDAYIRGATGGLCREAPVPYVVVQSSDHALGGAANVAANVAALGGECTLLSAVGDDLAGRQVTAALSGSGVDAAHVLVTANRGTLVKRRVVAGGHTLFRLDEGSRAPLAPADESALCRALPELTRSVDALIISDGGYGLLTGAVVDTLAGLRPSIPCVVLDAERPADYRQLRITAATPNYTEAVRLLGIPALDDRAARFRQVSALGGALLDATGAEMVVVTLDADGAVLFEPGRTPFFCYPGERPLPGIGAGDAFAAALALALTAGADSPAGVEFAALSASVAVEGTDGTAVASHAEISRRMHAADKVLAPADLASWAEAARSRGRRIVFTNGCFDILHEGHVVFLSQAKALGDLLVVGVNDDESVRMIKGSGRPVVELSARMRVLSALSCVDVVVPFSGPNPIPLIRNTRPHVFVKGGDYTFANLPEGDVLRELAVDIRFLDYLRDRSTTRIIEQVQAGSAGSDEQ